MKIKKLSVFLFLTLALTTVSLVSAMAAKPAGDGTEENPYKISTADELSWFQYYGTKNIMCVELTADIDISGLCNAEKGSWKPIGSKNEPFKGTFYGNDHTISGLYISYTKTSYTSYDYVGLFGYNSGKIEGLTVSGSIDNGTFYIGGICGYNEGIIKNCCNMASVNEASNVGGICGYNNDKGKIEGCTNKGTVSGNFYIGGICGYNENEVTVCHNEGTINGNSYVGGICGFYTKGKVADCYNAGTVMDSTKLNGNNYVGGDVGGICGESDAEITNCYSTAEGEINGMDSVGSICGINKGTITNCYNESPVCSFGNYAGGICGTNKGIITDCRSKNTVSGDHGTGGICGTNSGTISNCHNTGSCFLIEDSGSSFFGFYIGGICGENKGTINLCSNAAEVSGKNLVGGICGRNADENFGSGTIKNCFNTGELNTKLGYGPTGGISGTNFGIVTGCYNTAAVNGTHHIGGICGLNYKRVENSYNMGAVKGSFKSGAATCSYIGGICGTNVGDKGTIIATSVIENCYNTGTVSGYPGALDTGSICGYNEYTIINCYCPQNDSINGIGIDKGTSDFAVKTSEQFSSGEVCYLLNGGDTQISPSIWYQNINTDAFPMLDSKHGVVYKNGEAYSNILWKTGIDSGYFLKEGAKSGIVRFLAGFNDGIDVAGYGFIVSKDSSFSSSKTIEKIESSNPNDNGFYGDVIDIPSESDTVYAAAYIIVDGSKYYSPILEASPDFEKEIPYSR